MSESTTGEDVAYFGSRAAPTLKRDCPAPAPLVVNGSPYVGCQLEVGHDGPHVVRITWSS